MVTRDMAMMLTWTNNWVGQQGSYTDRALEQAFIPKFTLLHNVCESIEKIEVN
jgi:hypothetical protein